jgi:hypothetical protein
LNKRGRFRAGPSKRLPYITSEMRLILLACALSIFALGYHGQTDEIEALIHELPVEDAEQMGSPGDVNVFASSGGTSENSPAHPLARIGRPAVPQLIAALSDK